ncbi:unnamed protein product [Sympodiomycopsis kandeliae]
MSHPLEVTGDQDPMELMSVPKSAMSRCDSAMKTHTPSKRDSKVAWHSDVEKDGKLSSSGGLEKHLSRTSRTTWRESRGSRRSSKFIIPTIDSIQNFSNVYAFSVPPTGKGDEAKVAHRRAELAGIRREVLYGPDPREETDPPGQELNREKGPPYPAGILGEALAEAALATTGTELSTWQGKVENVSAKALHDILLPLSPNETNHGGKNRREIDHEAMRFKSLGGFQAIYRNKHIKELLSPANGGYWPLNGFLDSQYPDELFGMQRLSTQPYSLVRISSHDKVLPFEISDDRVDKITKGSFNSLKKIKNRGRLYYIDYRKDFLSLKLFENRYMGVCEAYFYLHKNNLQLLPLAIRIHPLDSNQTIPVPSAPKPHRSEDDDRQSQPAQGKRSFLSDLTNQIDLLLVDVKLKVKDHTRESETSVNQDITAMQDFKFPPTARNDASITAEIHSSNVRNQQRSEPDAQDVSTTSASPSQQSKVANGFSSVHQVKSSIKKTASRRKQLSELTATTSIADTLVADDTADTVKAGHDSVHSRDAPKAALVYTPLDSEAAWTLAKMVFSQNDISWGAVHHLSSTHYVLDVIYLTAIRTMHISHPIFALISRFTKDTFAIRRIFHEQLINHGGPWDQIWSFSGSEMSELALQMYRHEGAGKIEANYLQNDINGRGLGGKGARDRKHFLGKYGSLKVFQDQFPRIQNFPFYQDAKMIHDALRECIESYIHLFYSSDDSLSSDGELLNFVNEAIASEDQKGAGLQDFPADIVHSREALIDFLTHIAYLGAVKHNTLNTNVVTYANVVPSHPVAFYKPLPANEKEKDRLTLSDLAAHYLPNITQSVKQVTLANMFARPEYVGQEQKTISKIFDDPDLLRASPEAFKKEVKLFKRRMKGLSREIRSRNEKLITEFNPLAYTILDPLWSPYYAAI